MPQSVSVSRSMAQLQRVHVKLRAQVCNKNLTNDQEKTTRWSVDQLVDPSVRRLVHRKCCLSCHYSEGCQSHFVIW